MHLGADEDASQGEVARIVEGPRGEIALRALQGGTSVEGIILPQTYNEQSKYPAFIEFQRQFEQRFGVKANFAAAGGYDAAKLLIQALRETTMPEQIKEAILKQNVLRGLQGDIIIDQYGDARRETFLFTVKQGQFVLME